MQRSGIIEKVVRVCVEATKLEYVIQPIDLQWLNLDQRSPFLTAVRSYRANYPNVTIVEDAYVVFHGDALAARMFLVMLLGQADHPGPNGLRKHAFALDFAMRQLPKPALIFGGPDHEMEAFSTLLRREGSCLDASIFI